MLAILKSKTYQGKCTPNVLPCRINHTGPVDTSPRYWTPTETPDGKITAYFRGRKLLAKQLKVPAAYRGVVLSSTDRILPKKGAAQGGIEEEEEVDLPDVAVMEEQSTFEDVMVWGHEAVPDEMADPYILGMEEWISFAGEIHSYSSDSKADSDKAK